MSLRLKFLNVFLRIAVKPLLRRLNDPVKGRESLERAAKWFFRPVPLTLTLPLNLETADSEIIPALSIRNRPTLIQTGLDDPQPVIFYVHGGGYFAGSPRTHEKMLARISRLTKLEVIAPWYRLAPEHPFPAAFDDISAAFEGLIAKGHQASNIIIGGDSAGGGLALALMAKLCEQGTPPRALFAFSPLTDMLFQGASFSENLEKDPLFPAEQKALVTDVYLAGHTPDDPRASPLLAPFSQSPPPVFLQYSESELLRDDSRRMAKKLRQLGGHVEVDEWISPPHVWVLGDGVIPESRAALKRVSQFIKSN